MRIHIQEKPTAPAKFKVGDKVRVIGWGRATVLARHWQWMETRPQRHCNWEYIIWFIPGDPLLANKKLRVSENEIEAR